MKTNKCTEIITEKKVKFTKDVEEYLKEKWGIRSTYNAGQYSNPEGSIYVYLHQDGKMIITIGHFLPLEKGFNLKKEYALVDKAHEIWEYLNSLSGDENGNE